MKIGFVSFIAALALLPHVASAQLVAETPTPFKQEVSTLNVNETIFSGCLPSSSYAKIPVQQGTRIRIVATNKVAACDSRGWSNANGPFYGPEGTDSWGTGLAAGINSPLGMLIGAFRTKKIDGNMDWTEWGRTFQISTLFIGADYMTLVPINGYLYLIMNDGANYGDNIGSMRIEITVSKL